MVKGHRYFIDVTTKRLIMKVLILLGLLSHATALRISNNLPINSVLPSNQPSLSNLWPPPPNSNLQCQCTCEQSSNPGNHIYVSGDINIEPSRAQTTYTPDVTTTSFLTQIPVVLNNVEITHKRPVTDSPNQEQALASMTTTSAPPKNAAPEPGKPARAGAKPLSKGLLLRDRLKERRNRRIMLEQISLRSNPAGVQRSVGTRYSVPLRDPLKAIPETTTDRNSEARTETITTKSPMTGNDHTNGNGNGTGSNSGSSDGKSNRNGKGNSNGNDIGNGDQNGNSNRNGSVEGNRNSNSRPNGKTNGNGNRRPSAGNKNENKNGEQTIHDSNGKAGSGSNGNSKQVESRKQNNDNNNGNNSNNGSTSYKHVDGSGSNDRNDSVSAKDKMIIDLLQKLSSQTANNNNNNANNNNNNNVGGRISDRWHGGQANTGWNKAPSTYPTTTAVGFGFGVGFGMPPMMGMGMGDWIPSF